MAFIAWLENTEIETQEKLHQEIHHLMGQHHIREKWYEAIWNRVIGGDEFPIGPSFSLGFPSARWWREDDSIKNDLVIHENVDLANPIIQDFIKQWRENNRSTPPRPQPLADNQRKLDWTPVWEWWKRHPDVRVNELAQMLGYERSYVSRKLSEIHEETSSHNSE